ncbi:MAG: sporulation protein YqfC [Oscillospiraceae bacterium]|jgi:sporulation protein YqfC|nr:sporulation protein YqfC [Oscillospiraceae bacterium]
MRKGKRRTIRHAQQLGLPEDVVLGLPRLVLHGNSSMTLENHHGALEYGSTRIRMRTGLGTLTILGSDLSLARMGRHDMMLRGEIQTICFDGAPETGAAGSRCRADKER